MNARADNTVPRSAPIGRRLARARMALVAVEFGRRLAITAAVAILFFGALLVADAAFELPLGARQIGLWIAIGVTAAAVIWTLASLITARQNDEQIALMVERKNPQLDSRLIGAVQFANGHATIPEGAPTQMAKATVREAESESRRMRFLDILDPRNAARAILLLLAVSVAGATWGIFNRDQLPALVRRALGDDTPLPRETRITEAAGDKLIGIGDQLELAFTAEGVLPAQGELAIRYESGRREKAPLLPDSELAGRYLATIEDVPESFTFRAKINDASTEIASITAIERPEVESIGGTQTYPEFTGLAPTQHSPGDFALLPGSDLQLTLTANKPLASAIIQFVGTGEEIALKVDGERATTRIPVPDTTLGGFTVTLKDNKGLDSKDSTVYRVTQLTDRPPEVRITFPRRAEELVTRRARVLIRYKASDRFGIAGVALRYRRDDSAEPGALPLEIATDVPKFIDGELEWDLSQLDPPATEGEVLEYWIEASDQNTAGDRVGKSESLRVKVVTPDEKRADLLGRASDTLGGVGETTEDQRRLNDTLKKLIQDAASSP